MSNDISVTLFIILRPCPYLFICEPFLIFQMFIELHQWILIIFYPPKVQLLLPTQPYTLLTIILLTNR